MIHTYIPYCPKEKGQDLGWAYNNFMSMLSDDDWACFLDHDAMFTTRDWYHQLEEMINKYPDAGVFTAKTNRIGNKAQVVPNVSMSNHNMFYHRSVGKKLQSNHRLSVTPSKAPQLLSGVVILISKKVWDDIGGCKSGFLSVDNDIHQRCLNKGYSAYIMDGVYTYHWYRADGDLSHIGK